MWESLLDRFLIQENPREKGKSCNNNNNTSAGENDKNLRSFLLFFYFQANTYSGQSASVYFVWLGESKENRQESRGGKSKEGLMIHNGREYSS